MDGHKRQREQSGRMIETALFELMREKNFAQITVSEIVKRADVARRTFYRLYRGKEEVIHGYFEKLCQAYRSAYPALEGYDLGQIAEDYFGFWYRHREVLLLMNQCGLEGMLYYEISRASEDIVKYRMEGREPKPGLDVKYFADYSTGGFILLLHRWIAEGMRERPEQYARKVSGAILKFISDNGIRHVREKNPSKEY